MTAARLNGPPPDARNPESRMIAEYVAEKFPTYRTTLRQPMGPPTPGTEGMGDLAKRLRASRPWRPEVDAVVVFGSVLLLIEAKMVEYLSGAGKLPFYGSLVRTTPELEPWRDLEVRLRLVIPREAPWILDAAAGNNVEVDVFWRDWMQAYFDYREHNLSREGRREAAARREAIARLGL
jgi:hypothetical protein